MKPMLAATVEKIEELPVKYFPMYASPKLDGIRALVIDGVLVSRNLKPIPNKFIQDILPLERMNGWDGELIVGKPYAEDCFRTTTSGVMSVEGQPEFTFWVFDNVIGRLDFVDRLKGLAANIKTLNNSRVKLASQVLMRDAFSVYEYETKMLERGFEGVMLRRLDGAYKFGRSTLREGFLMKLKRFSDSEAEVLDVVEQMENTNEKTTDALGHSKRSSHKAGKVAKGTLGALRVKDIYSGVEFDIGTGFDDKLRDEIWKNAATRSSIVGRIIKYKFFPSGSKDKPRFPVFLGIRSENDIS